MGIYINGEIYKDTVNLESLKGDVIVHINSLGGDVFAALAINNKLKTCNATCIIEGVCGSAATLIACGCKKVTMCENALYMIHNPVVELWSEYTKEDLEKIQNSLEKIRNTIVEIYASRTGKSTAEIEELMKSETWYSAAEAKSAGFIDDIEGVADTEFDGENLISNSVRFNCSKYDKKNIERKVNTREHILAAERLRIKKLTARLTGDEYIEAIVKAAIEQGDTVEKIECYLSALNKLKMKRPARSLIEDNLNSGAENVLGTGEKINPETERIHRIATYANELRIKN